MGYSLPRCHAVRLLRASNSSCSYCLSNRGLVNWALETERCYQTKLLTLAQERSNSNKSISLTDPQNCLSFEEEGLQTLNSCYEDGYRTLCNIVSSYTNQDHLISDLTKVINAISISDYYKPLVRRQLRSLITSCGQGEVANQVAPLPPTRVLFCAVENKDVEPPISTHAWLSLMADSLNEPLTRFMIANTQSNDTRVNMKCRSRSSPLAGVALRNEYRLVQWLPTDSTLAENLQDYYRVSLREYNTNAHLVFFDIDTTYDTCGNGVREAGEDCDRFGENGLEPNPSCNEDCRMESGFECSTHQMVLTECSATQCGNGHRTSNEECDDGNTISGDGCDSSCKIEQDFSCSRTYNESSKCNLIPKPTPSSTSSSSPPTSSSLSSEEVLPSLSSLPLSPSIILTETSTPPELEVTSSSSIVRTSAVSIIVPVLLVISYLLMSGFSITR